mgnify:FL=1
MNSENTCDNSQAQALNKTDVSSSYDWLKNQNYAYVTGIIGFPVKVEILSFDFEKQNAVIKTEHQSGVLDFKKLFRFEKEADCI